jgi:hypothetical protein
MNLLENFMPWIITTPITIWAVTTFVLMALMWFKQPDNKLTGVLFALDFLLYYLFWVACVNWVILIYWIWLIPIPFIIILLFHYRRRFDRPAWVGKVPWLPGKSLASRILLAVAMILTLGLGYLTVRVILSFDYKSAPGDPLLLWFPVRQGAYVIANGGNAIQGLGLSTYYRGWFGSNGDKMSAYAVDVVKLWNLGGGISQGILPNSNLKYKIYEDPVNGPCMGTIVYIEDGHPDVKPFTQPTSELGNYIVIQCADSFVTLANLRNGSIKFQPGERINMTVWIANVGNSGSPSIPHLHIVATRGGWRPGTGTPVPILFDGAYAVNQFATRNKIFVP